METLVMHNDYSVMAACWVSLFFVCSYWYGTIKFDHENIVKAYDVIDEYITRDTKTLFKKKLGNPDTFNDNESMTSFRSMKKKV